MKCDAPLSFGEYCGYLMLNAQLKAVSEPAEAHLLYDNSEYL
jgi:hypothetical protein